MWLPHSRPRCPVSVSGGCHAPPEDADRLRDRKAVLDLHQSRWQARQ